MFDQARDPENHVSSGAVLLRDTIDLEESI